MSRLIDAEWLKELYQPYESYNGKELAVPIGAILANIDDAPTIDAVSVVRCRECRHKYQEPWNNGVAVEGECEIWHSATLADDFCSYGERKDDE